MFDKFNGLPLHVLVIHAVVVLVPLAAVGVLAIAVRPAWRRTYGWLVLMAATGALVTVPVAIQSGKFLRGNLGFPDDFRHGQLGQQMIFFIVPFWLLSVALVLLDRRRPSRSAQGWPLIAVAALASITGLAATVQVARTGDSGAQAEWSGRLK